MSLPDPPCPHSLTSAIDWDYGLDPETGYQDIGSLIACRECGEEFTPEEFQKELDTLERDRNPEAGDVYKYLGQRLAIVDSGGDDVYYVCRDGAYTGPLRSVQLYLFREQLRIGLLTRVHGSAIK